MCTDSLNLVIFIANVSIKGKFYRLYNTDRKYVWISKNFVTVQTLFINYVILHIIQHKRSKQHSRLYGSSGCTPVLWALLPNPEPLAARCEGDTAPHNVQPLSPFYMEIIFCRHCSRHAWG